MFLSRRSLVAAKTSRQSLDWKSAWAIASAVCLLILSTPGVHVVQASDDIGLAPGGQTCEAPGLEDVNMSLDLMLERLRRARTAQVARSGEPIHALNNSGFNYRPAPAPPQPSQGRPLTP